LSAASLYFRRDAAGEKRGCGAKYQRGGAEFHFSRDELPSVRDLARPQIIPAADCSKLQPSRRKVAHPKGPAFASLISIGLASEPFAGRLLARDFCASPAEP
jgi:hypothetical protein